jgi:hypothetical protein
LGFLAAVCGFAFGFAALVAVGADVALGGVSDNCADAASANISQQASIAMERRAFIPASF